MTDHQFTTLADLLTSINNNLNLIIKTNNKVLTKLDNVESAISNSNNDTSKK